MRAKRIMRDKPNPERRALAAWYHHVLAVSVELRRAAEAPPWWRRMWAELGEYFGFNLKQEFRGLVRRLLDLEPIPRQGVVDLDQLERGLSELAIARTALTYRIHEPEQRETALQRIRQAEALIAGSRR